VVPARVQVGLGRFAYLRALQDCHSCIIGGKYVSYYLDIKIEPRTATIMEITHPFGVKRLPRARTLSFWIVVTDQFDRRHYRRVRLARLY
jgi:hypothetical protein